MNQFVAADAMRKTTLRIVPLLFMLWLVNFLDRVNVSFAALDMTKAFHFTPELYGFGAGIFFIGYILFEIPSNLALQRFGARVWLTRIIVTWGIVSALQAFIFDATSFVAIRFLLGVAEAGFLPGVLYYLTRWFPAERRARAIGQVMSANMIAVVVGAPLSAAIMSIDHAAGLAGWQWMFIVEAVPAVALGVVTYCFLSDEPQQATWLSAPERAWLVDAMQRDRAAAASIGTERFGDALREPIVWLLGLLYLMVGVGFFGITLWLPQIVRQIAEMSTMRVGLFSAVPFLLGAVAMVVNGRHSDRTLERRWHLALPLAIGSLGLAASAVAPSAVAAMACVCVAMLGIGASLSVFWSIPSSFLTGRAAAGGLALVNMISGLSGFVGPYVIGWIRGHSPDFANALFFMAGSVAIAALLAAVLPFPVAPGGRVEPASRSIG
ncbi:MFS transporter [Burkholderia multivorans]|uniref:MFS transporter n=1 Tax=Burkholderia ubonensis TaxID=101571 RepID=UPI000F6D1109|nr:MFS transporter [Burkholderia ubonensis]AYZ67960.1 MFS transporter [Burkholderia multivorans]VWB77767.1 membrane protein [Burkholderia ubonensis]